MRTTDWQAEKNRQDINALKQRVGCLRDVLWAVITELAQHKGTEDTEGLLSFAREQLWPEQ